MRKQIQKLLISCAAIAVLSLTLAGGYFKGPADSNFSKRAGPSAEIYALNIGYYHLDGTEEAGRKLAPKWDSTQW